MKTWLAVVVIGVMAGAAHAERDRLELVSDAVAKSNAGDHAAAIALYEQAYFMDLDPSLLPILATEYRLAGLPGDAITYFCQYLSTQPKGPQAAYAATQVLALRAELGQPVAKGRVCEAPKPVRNDVLTPRTPRAPEGKATRGMSKREIGGIASAALGAASLALGAYYGFEARSISNELTNHSPAEAWPDNIQDLEARGQRYEHRQNTFMLVGAAAVVTGGILFFTGRHDRLSSESPQSNLHFAPTVSPGGAGISFSRGF